MSRDEVNAAIQRCILCGERFDLSTDKGYGDVLDHWAEKHNHTEEFWRTVDEAKTWTRCCGCGEMFVSPIGEMENSLTVRSYCDECCDHPAKSLIIEDVTGRYVIANEQCEETA